MDRAKRDELPKMQGLLVRLGISRMRDSRFSRVYRFHLYAGVQSKDRFCGFLEEDFRSRC